MNSVDTPRCVKCGTRENLAKHSIYRRKNGDEVQRYICRTCNLARKRAQRGHTPEASTPLKRMGYEVVIEQEGINPYTGQAYSVTTQHM